MEQSGAGRKPAGDGWFVVNARDAGWLHNERFGSGVIFESVERRSHHIFVCAGDGPCAFLGVGARNAGEGIVYPRSDLALRHGAGADERTTDPGTAYAGAPETTTGPYAEGLRDEYAPPVAG